MTAFMLMSQYICLLSDMKVRKIWHLSSTSVHVLPKWDFLLITEVVARVLMHFPSVTTLADGSIYLICTFPLK